MYDRGRGVRQDYAEAFRWYMKGADAGNILAMYVVGHSYNFGQGVRRDYEQARRWYEKAAALNYAPAMNNLGVFYHNGVGVRQDHSEAARWYRKAAELGHKGARDNLARLGGRSSGSSGIGGGGSTPSYPMRGPAYCGQSPAGTPGC